MTRTLDLATFTVPTGWRVEKRETGTPHAVMWTASATASCAITVYASRVASGNLAASFAAEWTRVALQTLAPGPTPRAAESAIGDLRVAIGGRPRARRANRWWGCSSWPTPAAASCRLCCSRPASRRWTELPGVRPVPRAPGRAPGGRAGPARASLRATAAHSHQLAGELGTQRRHQHSLRRLADRRLCGDRLAALH